MDAAERELFARSLRDAIDRGDGPIDAALERLGWHDALATDARDAVSTLFELQGRTNTTSSALSAVVAGALGGPATAVVLPALGHWAPPATLEDDRITIDGLALIGLEATSDVGSSPKTVRRDGPGAVLGREATPDVGPRPIRAAGEDQLRVVAHAGDKDIAVVVATATLDLRRVHGVDPGLGLVRVTGEVATSDPQPVDWAAAVAAGQRAVGHDLVGVSRKMLELACEHALDRVQFDRPIATFQAVRHRLADTLVAIETADAALAAAWDEDSPVSASMAKAFAGRAARTAARHCQQVLAGIGFTTEHPLHHSLRRALVLDQLLGSSKLLTAELGNTLAATRQLPPLQPL